VTSAKQTLRVYRCPHCGYTGYRPVHGKEEDSACNLCSGTVSPKPSMKYVRTVKDATRAVQQMLLKQRSTEVSTKSRHGLGVRRRVFNVISDLSDLNRGRGVSRKSVMEECREAQMDLDKVRRFIRQLVEAGHVNETDGVLIPVEEDDW